MRYRNGRIEGIVFDPASHERIGKFWMTSDDSGYFGKHLTVQITAPWLQNHPAEADRVCRSVLSVLQVFTGYRRASQIAPDLLSVARSVNQTAWLIPETIDDGEMIWPGWVRRACREFRKVVPW